MKMDGHSFSEHCIIFRMDEHSAFKCCVILKEGVCKVSERLQKMYALGMVIASSYLKYVFIMIYGQNFQATAQQII